MGKVAEIIDNEMCKDCKYFRKNVCCRPTNVRWLIPSRKITRKPSNSKDNDKKGFRVYRDWGGDEQLKNKNKLKQKVYKYLWEKFYQHKYSRCKVTCAEDIDQATKTIMRIIK